MIQLKTIKVPRKKCVICNKSFAIPMMKGKHCHTCDLHSSSINVGMHHISITKKEQQFFLQHIKKLKGKKRLEFADEFSKYYKHKYWSKGREKDGDIDIRTREVAPPDLEVFFPRLVKQVPHIDFYYNTVDGFDDDGNTISEIDNDAIIWGQVNVKDCPISMIYIERGDDLMTLRYFMRQEPNSFSGVEYMLGANIIKYLEKKKLMQISNKYIAEKL